MLYAGLAVLLGASICLIRPLRWTGLANRRRAGAAALAGAAVAACGLYWPVERTESSGVMLLDEWQRESHFREVHSVVVAASPERVMEAAKEVTFGELKVYGVLMLIRSLAMGRSSGAALGNAPILGAMTGPGGGFSMLGEQPGREVVMGAAMRSDVKAGRRLTGTAYREFCEPGWVKVAFNIRAEPAGGGLTWVSTETRVLGCGRASAESFGRYWRFVYPGSALIRKMWLDSMLARSERRRMA